MDDTKEVASLSLHVNSEALRSVISSGRLLPLSTLRTPRCRDARRTRSRPAC
jgi:hypothetical protein